MKKHNENQGSHFSLSFIHIILFQYVFLVCFQQAVQIIMPLKDVKVNEKEGRMKLMCEAKFEGSKPKWFKDGKEIAPGKKCRMKAAKGEIELTVFDIGPGDKGEYKVKFDDGTESKCKVTIDSKYECIAPGLAIQISLHRLISFV